MAMQKSLTLRLCVGVATLFAASAFAASTTGQVVIGQDARLELAKQGSVEDQLRLGTAYLNGAGVPQNFASARILLESASNGGSADATLMLARMHFEGRGYRKDAGKARQLAREAAVAGNVEAAMWVLDKDSEVSGSDTHITDILGVLEKAAESGNGAAAYQASIMWSSGRGAPADEIRAMHYVRIGAEQKHPGASWKLGRILFFGNTFIGIDRQQEAAIPFLEVAADANNADAAFLLGLAHASGSGVPTSDKLAFENHLKSAELGNLNAQLSVSRRYSTGKGTYEDKDAAQMWILRAADSGLVEAACQYAFFNAHDLMLEYDEKRKRTSAQRALKYALLGVGQPLCDPAILIASRSLGTPEDLRRAFAAASRLARSGNVSYMHALGEAFEKGEGVKTDREEAYFWYLQAAARTDPEHDFVFKRSVQARDRLGAELSSEAVDRIQARATEWSPEKVENSAVRRGGAYSCLSVACVAQLP